MTPSDEPARVVFAWPYVEWGGAQRYLFVIMRRLAAPFTVVLPAGSDPALLDDLATLGASIHSIPSRLIVTHTPSVGGRLRRRLRSWRVQWQFLRACRQAALPSSVLHCEVSPFEFTVPLAILARRTAVVVTVHTTLPRLGRLRRLFWRARMAALVRTKGFRLIAANRHVRDSLVPYMPTSGVSAIPVALSPVEQDEIDRARARSLSQDHVGGIPRDTGRFLVVTGAQFIARKGCHVLAEAAPLVRRVAPDVDFLWLGPMPLAAADAEMARAAGIRYVAQAELEHRREEYLALVARADLFVLPSFEEGLPLALIEAMALGVAAVATPVNAVTEAITHGETGLLVAPGDAAALAAAILQLRSDPDLRRQIAQAGQVHARRFDANETARVTMRVYEEAAGRMAGLQP